MICIAKYCRTNNDSYDMISILNTDKEIAISLSVWLLRSPHNFPAPSASCLSRWPTPIASNLCDRDHKIAEGVLKTPLTSTSARANELDGREAGSQQVPTASSSKRATRA